MRPVEHNNHQELQNQIQALKKASGHIVQFYDNDEKLAAVVMSFVEPMLLRNEGMIIIATKKHCQTFEESLQGLGLNVSNIKKSKQLMILDAEEILSKIVINQLPDATRFNLVIGGLIEEIEKQYPIVNIYGEMVSPREYIVRKYVDVYPELVGSIAHKSLIDILVTGIPFVAHEMKLKIINPEWVFEEQYFDYANIRIMDAEGKPYGVYCNAVNVTERVLARKRLEKAKAETEIEAKRADRERAKLEAAFQAVAEGIFIFDTNGESVFMNDTAVKVFNLSSKNDVTHSIEYYFKRLELRDLDDNIIPFSEGPVSLVLQGKLFRDWQLKARCLNTGSEWVWNFSGELTRQAESNTVLGVIVLRDITQQKKAEDELKAAKIEAEKANHLKSAFLANMSHEIRTPLGAMVGFADLLKDPSLSREEHDNYIDILIRSGDQLSMIINDILDLSKVEAGHMKLDYVETDPKTIATDIVSLLSVKAKEKNLILEFLPDESTPSIFITDPGRVKQILMNIVGNAIKFTQVGSIKIKSYGIFEEKKGNLLYFEVTDTGIGISKEEHEGIFKAFVQADSTLARKFGGTGLGLALSRQLARHLGGDISITESIEGKGSVFLVCIQDKPQLLTLEETRKVEEVFVEQPLSEGKLEGVKVLVVDDSPDNRQLFGHFLNHYGAVVDFAENGVIGVRKALGSDFDVVLMDIQMPEMDGYTATQRLREVGYRKPIIALTAHAMTEVRKKCLSVGCTDHLTKPIKSQSLINTVAKYSLR